MKHDSKIWNLPRKVEVSYKSGWQCKRTKFKSLAECEGYLKKEIGDDTYIHLPDREVEDAVSAEVITGLCGNTAVCAMVSLGDAAWKGKDTTADVAATAWAQAKALRAMREAMGKWEDRVRECAERLEKSNDRQARKDYGKTVRALKENIRLFAKDFGKGM